MQLLFAKSKWEKPEAGLPEFLAQIKEAGFDASELYLPAITETDREVREAHAGCGLRMIAQIVTDGETPAAHGESLRRLYDRALSCGAMQVNCHTGADWFAFADNMQLFEAALELEGRNGTTICHETHRGRALYNAPDTLRYLAGLPELRLTADLSHWQVVHETDDLARQSAAVDAVVRSAWHIHARVGSSQAPQVSDPRAPEFAAQFAVLRDIWHRILQARAADKADFVAVTPEFGPPPYQQVEPRTGRPAADPWQVNLWMRESLRRSWSSTAFG